MQGLLWGALTRGGITAETLNQLIQTESDLTGNEDLSDATWKSVLQANSISRPVSINASQTSSTGRPNSSVGTALIGDYSTVQNGQWTPANSYKPWQSSWKPESGNKSTQNAHFVDMVDDDFDQPWTELVAHTKSTREKHTVALMNLPSDVTHRDITNVVRGGQIVDIWLRRGERVATITFATGASDFVSFARRHDLHVKDKKVEVAWSERQFVIPQHLAQKAAKGVSRNLVIRGGASKLTEGRIRDDLDHIHNCIVIAVIFKDLDVYISTNSINNAMFARSCMSSRAAYKGLRIDWYPDECNEPLPRKSSAEAASAKSTGKNFEAKRALTNRFDLLNMDTSEDKSDESIDDDSAETSGVQIDF